MIIHAIFLNNFRSSNSKKFFRRDREEPNSEEYDDYDFLEIDESGIDSDRFDRIGNRPNRPNKNTPWKTLTMTDNPYLGKLEHNFVLYQTEIFRYRWKAASSTALPCQ